MRFLVVYVVLLVVCAGLGGCGAHEEGPTGVVGSDAGVEADAETSGDAAALSDAGEADASQADADSDAAGLCTSCGDCVESQQVSSALHVSTPIEYTDLPPLGGNHAPCWTSFGVHTSEVLDERWVHNLEHGAVVFLYHCPDGCPDELARLTALAGSRPFALVTPYAALPSSFAVVAWGHRLVSECFDEEAFIRFYDEHANQAPESSSSDGSC